MWKSLLDAISSGFARIKAELDQINKKLGNQPGSPVSLQPIPDGISDIKTEQAKQRLILEQILAAITPGPTANAVVAFYLDGQPLEGKNMIIKDSQQVAFTITVTDAQGKPSSIDPTKTVITADKPDVAIVTINPDGLGGTVKAGTTGTAALTGSVTDANNPTDTITLTIDSIQVVAGDTTAAIVNFGAPTDQAPATA